MPKLKSIHWENNKELLILWYKEGFSPGELSRVFPYKRTTIREMLKREGYLRSVSESFKLAYQKGLRPQLKLGQIALLKYENRYHPKKIHRGTEHPLWVSDRTKLKPQRMHTEEKWFFKEVLTERNFTCELTGQKGGKLSVHHLDGVRDHKELQFDKNNVIVITQKIHKLFHKLYGTMSVTREKFEKFKREQGYV